MRSQLVLKLTYLFAAGQPRSRYPAVVAAQGNRPIVRAPYWNPLMPRLARMPATYDGLGNKGHRGPAHHGHGVEPERCGSSIADRIQGPFCRSRTWWK
jgi:hypothetical protein